MNKSGSPENQSASELVDRRIANLADWRGEILSMMRKLIQDADPDVVEEVKWRKPSNSMLGVPVWSHDGIICTGELYRDKVKFTFARGASLEDTGGSVVGRQSRSEPSNATSRRELVALVVDLRGVNVGDHRTFRPTTLTKQLAHLNALNIGAAGTFVIRQPVTQAQLRAELASRIPFDTEIMIYQGREIVRLMSHHHFADQPIGPDLVRFVSVLSKRPRSMPSMPMNFPPSGRWLLRPSGGYCESSQGTTRGE